MCFKSNLANFLRPEVSVHFWYEDNYIIEKLDSQSSYSHHRFLLICHFFISDTIGMVHSETPTDSKIPLLTFLSDSTSVLLFKCIRYMVGIQKFWYTVWFYIYFCFLIFHCLQFIKKNFLTFV